MSNQKLSKAQSQLYTQFLYKILKYNEINKNIYIACITPSLYKSGPSFDKFRKIFLKSYNQIYSMIFCASHFSGLSNLWAVDFTIFEPKESLNKNEFHSYVKDLNKNGEIVITGEKVMYNLDGE